MSRFIKKQVTERQQWLRDKNYRAYYLLEIIAERARFKDSEADFMKAGWAFIGYEKKFEKIMTHKQFRIAMQFLEKEKFIQIIAKNHKFVFDENTNNYLNQKNGIQEDEKRAIERATNSTLVNIVDDSVWDVICPDQKEINQKKGNQKGNQDEQKRASEGQPKGNKQERNEERNEKGVALKKETKKKAIEPSPISAFSFTQSDFASFIAAYRLPDGNPLSLRMQRSLLRAEADQKVIIVDNMKFYLDRVEKGEISPKGSHEKYLQEHISKNYFRKNLNKTINADYAKSIAKEKPFVKVLKTVVQIGKKGDTHSIDLDQETNRFYQILENMIEHYEIKNLSLK